MSENERPAADAALENEVRQLRASVRALREELERTRIAADNDASRARAAADDEHRQLQLTAHTLREELERLRVTSENKLSRALATAADENRQLQLTAQTLRKELERLRVTGEDKLTSASSSIAATSTTRRPTSCACVKRWRRRVPAAHNRKGAVARRLGRTRLVELLLDVSNRLSVSRDLTEAIDTLVRLVAEHVGAERGSVFLHDASTSELFSRVAEGKFSREIRMQDSIGIAGAVFASGKGAVIDDPYSDPRFNRAIDMATGFITKNVACVPLRTLKGEVVGVAELLNKHDGMFTQHDLDLFELMIEQAAVALEHHRTVEAIESSRRQELAFLNVVTELSSELQLRPLLSKLIHAITKMLDAERSTLFLNDERRKELYTVVGEGLGSTVIRFPNDRGIAGAVFTTGETINIPYAYADLRFNPSFDKTTGFFTRSILCVPVTNKQSKVIGVTQVLNRRGGAFTAEDEARLKAFTSQIAIGLENAQLFDDIQNMKNYNVSVLESMSNAVITLDEEHQIVTCNAAGTRLFKQRPEAIVGTNASAFFASNAWIIDLIRKVDEKLEGTRGRPMRRLADRQTPQEMILDAELLLPDDEKASVNLTVLPLIGIGGAKMGSMLMIEDISTEKRVKATMSRYMDASLADQLLKSDQSLLGGQSSVATVLFTDIRGYTTLTEDLGPQDTVQMLNEYFTLMVECIQREQGMLDKFIGDAIMAVFGTPISHGDDEDRAVRSAVQMLRELATFNMARAAAGKKPIDMGIGINTDSVISGNIGSPKRMDYTVIGDGVNLASRIEGACKPYGAKILVSEYTFAKLRGTYRHREIDKIIVKGKTQPVAIYEILEHHTAETFPKIIDVLAHFRHGLDCYRRQRWDDAIKAFKDALRLHPTDKASKVYVERCEYFKQHAPGDDWAGVWVFETK
jgi:adenylate cyclase